MRATRRENAFKDRIKERVNVFIVALAQTSADLMGGEPSIKMIKCAIQTLSKVRSIWNSKHNQGLILLDQYFSVA